MKNFIKKNFLTLIPIGYLFIAIGIITSIISFFYKRKKFDNYKEN